MYPISSSLKNPVACAKRKEMTLKVDRLILFSVRIKNSISRNKRLVDHRPPVSPFSLKLCLLYHTIQFFKMNLSTFAPDDFKCPIAFHNFE